MWGLSFLISQISLWSVSFLHNRMKKYFFLVYHGNPLLLPCMISPSGKSKHHNTRAAVTKTNVWFNMHYSRQRMQGVCNKQHMQTNTNVSSFSALKQESAASALIIQHVRGLCASNGKCTHRTETQTTGETRWNWLFDCSWEGLTLMGFYRIGNKTFGSSLRFNTATC